MSVFYGYISKLIRKTDDSLLNEEERNIKKQLSYEEFIRSEESKNFNIHSEEVKDILDSIPVKEDAISIHSYILGFKEVSEIEAILNVLPFEDDKQKILKERAERTLAGRIESSKKKDRNNPIIITTVGLIFVCLCSSIMLDLSRTKNPITNHDNEIFVNNPLCGKEVRQHFIDIFELNKERIKSCKQTNTESVVRVGIQVLPNGMFENIIIDSDNKENEKLTKCLYGVISSFKSEKICESIRINKTLYL